jgi:hypothetical protein
LKRGHGCATFLQTNWDRTACSLSHLKACCLMNNVTTCHWCRWHLRTWLLLFAHLLPLILLQLASRRAGDIAFIN